MVVFTGVVVACIGATSEPPDRRENASDVVGKLRTVRNRSSELYMKVFILSPLWKIIETLLSTSLIFIYLGSEPQFHRKGYVLSRARKAYWE